MRTATIRAPAALIAATAAALALAACGSPPPAGTSASPATIVPANASVYLDATLRPEGQLARNASADEKTMTGSGEPLAAIVSELARASGLPKVGYASEVKPWAGPDAGLFLAPLSALEGLEGTLAKSLGESLSPQSLLGVASRALATGHGIESALVLDTSDLGKARAFLAKLASRDGAHARSFDGVSYELDAAGGASGVVGKFVVIGNEAGMRSVIETHAGHPALSAAPTYATLDGKANARAALLSLYLDAEPVASTASGAPAPRHTSSGAGLLAALPGEPHAALLTLTPQSHALSVHLRLLSAASGSAASGTSEAEAAAKLVGELPASSWLALGAGGAGTHVGSYVRAFATIATIAGKSLLASFGGAALEALARRLAQRPHALETIFSGRASTAALFAGGRGLLEIQAGLLVEMHSSADAAAAVSGLAAALSRTGAHVAKTSLTGAESAESVKVSGLPFVLDLGARGTRVAFGLGPGSVQAALAPPQGALSTSALYSEASRQLGGARPVLLLDFPTLLSFLEGLGLTEGRSLSGVVAYLRPLGALAGAVGKPEGAVEQLQFVLPLAG
ncbi:MAG: DUF3352 domain-containing protein [Solirubrobacteraceae bacterium]